MSAAASNRRDDCMKYLLRRMSEEEREAFQARLLEDEQLFEEVEDAENDLFDDYANGRLSQQDRDAVEQSVLKTEGAEEKLRMARALAAGRPGSRTRWMRKAMAIAAAIVIGAFVWITYNGRVSRNGPSQPTPTYQLVIVPTLRLVPATRGEALAIPHLNVPASSPSVAFSAPTPAGPRSQSYNVQLRTVKGSTIWSAEVTPQNEELRWMVPAASLQTGKYECIILTGTSEVGFYEFSLTRE